MALGVIPARHDSSRFPGKVLFPLLGKPMVQWVWEQACKAASLEHVMIATDSEAVYSAARRFDADVIMTRADHPSGTSRVAEVATRCDGEIILNIQADEPLLDPAILDGLIETLRVVSWADIATPALPITESTRLTDPNVVKLVMNHEHRILFFSRAPIPHGFHPEPSPGITWEHQGLYAFRRDVLLAWDSLPSSPLETAEQLEQLRFMDAGFSFVGIVASQQSPGVNTPRDAAEVEQILRRKYRGQ